MFPYMTAVIFWLVPLVRKMLEHGLGSFKTKRHLLGLITTQRDSDGAEIKTCELIPARSEPSSRTFLIGEQPNAWDLLQPRAKVSRHRGAELRRRYGRLGGTSLLSPG